MFTDLAKRVCVFTGASGILGSAMTAALCAQGVRVAMLARNDGKLLAQEQSLTAQGYEVLSVAADVLNRESLIKARDIIHEKWGKVDILVNCAGGNNPDGTAKAEQMFADTPLNDTFFGMKMDGFAQVFDLNFHGTLLPTMIFADDMRERGGSIINISSMSAQLPLTKVGAYSAAKAAVDNFTRWLATHLAPLNIRVNAIAPGFFVTEQNRFLLYQEDGKTLSARGEKIIKATPMAKFGSPDDLGGALVYLVSDVAKFVTGIVLPVDGGFSCYAGV